MSPSAPFYIVLNAGSGHSDTETTCQTIAEVPNAGWIRPVGCRVSRCRISW